MDQAMYNNQLFSAKTLEEAFTPYSNEKAGIKIMVSDGG